jgi:cystathionine beta-lyase family protein involved in aluminum resistance
MFRSEEQFMQQPFFCIHPKIQEAADKAQKKISEQFTKIDEITEYNQLKVLSAFIKNGVSESHFIGSTGYGYGDRGREVLDKVYAEVFGCEDALVRHNFVSGTHALVTVLFGILRPNDTLLSITGSPYDTLEVAIGLRGSDTGSLADFGIKYKQVDLLDDSSFDIPKILEAIDESTKMIYIQRSRGYSQRKALSVKAIGEICEIVKAKSKNIVVMVDNCYGEFVEIIEPTGVGADIIAGSLIKNPGAGLADTGGYIAGRADLIEKCAFRLTSPGMGKEVGCTLNQSKGMFRGLFFAPLVVGEAMKTAIFAAALFDILGYEVSPNFRETRSDIIQVIKLGNKEALIAFCQGIQKGSPVDSFVIPEPWDMPGYENQVIMAAGAFTQGASIELSADAPIKEPYTAYMQGGLTYASGKMGVMLAANSIWENKN